MNVELEKNRKPRDSGDCRSGFGREFLPHGAAVWIPVALFVLLVLFQMIPLPMGVLKVVSPATYELYEEILPEVGKRQRPEVRGQRSEGQGQKTKVRGQRSEAGGQGAEVGRVAEYFY